MKNKLLLFTIVLVGIFSLNSFVSADYVKNENKNFLMNLNNVERQAEMEIFRAERETLKSELRILSEKQVAGEVLTQEELEKLNSFGAGNKGECGEIRKFDGNGKMKNNVIKQGKGQNFSGGKGKNK